VQRKRKGLISLICDRLFVPLFAINTLFLFIKTHNNYEEAIVSVQRGPDDWALCFQDACPLHEECQRWLAGSYAPKKMTVRPYSYKVFALSGHCFLLTVLLSRRDDKIS